MLIWRGDTHITGVSFTNMSGLSLQGGSRIILTTLWTVAIKKAGHSDSTVFAQVDTDLLCVANVFQILGHELF